MNDGERVVEAFWAQVDKSGECWVWTGKSSREGYGQTRLSGVYGAHRIGYTLAYGDIPQGMCVCHRCDNPPCVRPDHLFLGTHADNQRDRFAKGRVFVRPRNPEGYVRPAEAARRIGITPAQMSLCISWRAIPAYSRDGRGRFIKSTDIEGMDGRAVFEEARRRRHAALERFRASLAHPA